MCRSSSSPSEQSKGRITYWGLLSEHANYRWFLASYFVTHCGEWLTYVASMSLLEQQGNGSDDEDNSKHDVHYWKISLLVVVRLLPNTLFSVPGGILADTVDRQRAMVVLDVLGAVVALCYCLAVAFQSIAVLYLCTVVQETLSGLYEPSRSAILPQLVGTEYISKANAASAIAWSLTAAVGSSLGGFLTDRYGAIVCFVTDSVFYVVSAWIMAIHVRGDFSVMHEEDENKQQKNSDEENTGGDEQEQQTPRKIKRHNPLQMIRQMLDYLSSSVVGAYVLIKGCGALVFGASDVVYATFAEDDEEGLNSQRLGWMFAAVGVGCLLGPLLLPDERSHLNACIYAYAVLGAGYGLIGVSPQYWQKCVWTVFRSAGTAVLWVESSILIQTTTPLQMLGRVSAIDLALALTGESISAVMAGLLEDRGWTADEVAYLLSAGSLLFCLLWALWSKYLRAPRLLSKDSEITDETAVEMEPLR